MAKDNPAESAAVQKKGQTTIADVGRAAGVSIKTVSRVVNREPNVRPSTRLAVERAIAELNYRPNVSARSLASSRSYLVALMFESPSTSYTNDLQLGALRQCRAAGYHLIVEALDSSSRSFELELNQALENARADGYVLTPPLCDDPLVLETLRALGIRYVRIAPHGQSDPSPSVNIDDGGAAYELTAHLLDLGHRRIGFIKGHSGHGATHLRFGGYAAALRARGVPLDTSVVVQGDFSSRSGVAGAEALLTRGDRPTAIFASNDDMALGVYLVAYRLGLRIPHDLSVCGFNDSPIARLLWPQLTTVRQPVDDMSAAAVEMLLFPEAERPHSKLFEFTLVARDSTAPAPMDGT